jgi:pilin isopeptide linkage protein/LPXTG-motif cell wall-anchored protein
MKKVGFLKKAAASVLSLVLAVGEIPSPVMAADGSEVRASFQIVQEITGDTPKEKTDFSYVIASQNESAPLPEDCTATITIHGSEASKTAQSLEELGDAEDLEDVLAGLASFEITFMEPGSYSYTISQQEDPRNIENGYTHDESVYHIEVDVTHDMQGNLVALYEIYKDGNAGKSDSILFVNQLNEPEPVTEVETELVTEVETEPVTEIETEQPKVSMEFEKVDSETGEPVSGAVLRVIDADGTMVDEWTSDGSVHTITDQLIDGETYRLLEISAPTGYRYAEDILFTAAQDAKITMADEKKPEGQPENGSISVTKDLIFDGNAIGARDQIFYVAVYEDPECTRRVTGISPLEFKMTSEFTGVFDGLEPGKTYYISESDANGISIANGQVADGTLFYADFEQGHAVTAGVGADVPNMKFENEFFDIPYEFYLEGHLVITKKLVDADGNPEASFETFYAGIFADPEFTTLSDQVASNIIALPMDGASEASATVGVVLPETGAINLYVTEVDASGVPVSRSSDFIYEVSISGSSVSLSADNVTAETTITNRELPEQTESETTPEETETEPQTEIKTTPTPTPTSTSGSTPTPTTTTSSSNPKTGDTTNLALWLALLVIAALAVGGILVYKKKVK